MQRFFQFFEFTQTEKRGLLVLAILTLILITVPSIYSYLPNEYVPSHSLTLLNATHSFPSLDEERIYSNKVMYKKSSKKDGVHGVTYFSFNPNKLPRADWKKLGLSDKQIDVIYKYENKGGQFRKKEDVQKIYVINDKLYQALAPYIRIPEKSMPTKLEPTYDRKETSSKANKATISAIHINTTDSIQLQQIRGIGPVLSARIIKFRDLLGGFHHADQLKDVYGLSPEVREELLKYVVIDMQYVKKIAINTVTKEELQRHPYIRSKQAQLIINYRNQHGPFLDSKSLENLTGLDTEFLRKIAPYLKF